MSLMISAIIPIEACLAMSLKNAPRIFPSFFGSSLKSKPFWVDVGGGGGGGEGEGGLEEEVVIAEGSNGPSPALHSVRRLSSFCTVCHSSRPFCFRDRLGCSRFGAGMSDLACPSAWG